MWVCMHSRTRAGEQVSGVRCTLPLHVYMLVAIINFLCQEIFSCVLRSLLPFRSQFVCRRRRCLALISILSFFLFLSCFISSVCLFVYFVAFSMCLHEGDKVFNPLHAVRFRSLFSKSRFFCSAFSMLHNLIASLGVCVLFAIAFSQHKKPSSEKYFLRSLTRTIDAIAVWLAGEKREH